MKEELARGEDGVRAGEWNLPGEASLENLLGDDRHFLPVVHRTDHVELDVDLLVADGQDVVLEVPDVLQVLEVQAGHLEAGGDHQSHQTTSETKTNRETSNPR